MEMEVQQQHQLRQLKNVVEIVGTLKSKELEVKTSKNGNRFIGGRLVIESKFDNKIQELPVKVFVMETSKLYKGIETVKNEYKTIEDHGKENADRIKVTGEIRLNEYYGPDGVLRQYNEIRGVFFTRLDKNDQQPDKAIASIETVVEGYSERFGPNGEPTGEYNVQCFTVGWGNEVIELKDVIIGPELAEAFMSLYMPGSTGRLTYKINNYVELEEKQEEQPAQHGFGTTETVSAPVIKRFVSNLEIIGGDVPFIDDRAYTEEDIQLAKQIRALKLQSLQQPVPEVPPTNTGFGQTMGTPEFLNNPFDNQSASTPPITMPFGMENDMPDF
jgi:hypothetical protein